MPKGRKVASNQASARIRTSRGEEEVDLTVRDQPNFVVQLTEAEMDSGALFTEMEVKENCPCVGYDGQSLECEIHDYVVECPNCHCVNTEIDQKSDYDTVKNYRCGLCGVFYIWRTVDGEYLYTP